MTNALLPNLGFEYEISGHAVPGIVARQTDRFSHVLRLAPGFRDAVPIEDLDGETPTRLAAWGPSEQAKRHAPTACSDWPSRDCVRAANDKRTSHGFEVELGVGLPGARIVGAMSELDDAAASLDAGWIVKHPFGVAGRRAAVGEGRPTDADRRSVARLLSDAGSVVFEPRVEIDHEFSLHFDVTDAVVEYVGAVRLMTRRGTFRGNALPATLPPDTLPIAREVAEELKNIGWTGPVGIDGFVGRLGEGPVVRPLSEINARWSFGRLTLELARQIGTTNLSWHHPGRGADRPETSPLPDAETPGRWRLPEWCDPSGGSGTWLEIK